MKKKLPIIIGGIVILIIAVIAILMLTGKDDSKTEKEPKRKTETTSTEIVVRNNGIPRYVNGNYVKTKVDSKNDVFTALDEIKDMYGFTNAKSEFEIINTQTSNDITYYKLNQKYRNIPVYGYELVVAVNKDFEVTSITGNYIPGIDTSTYSITSIDKTEEKIKKEYGKDCEILAKDKYIYIYNDEAIYTYIYSIVNTSGVYDIVVNATTSEIIDEIMLNALAYEYTGKDALGVERTVTLNEYPNAYKTQYEFYDKDRNIIVMNSDGIGMEDADANPFNFAYFFLATKVERSGYIVDMQDGKIVEDANKEITVSEAVSTLYNYSYVYDYYYEKLGRKSYDGNGARINVNIGVGKYTLSDEELVNASWAGNIIGEFFFGSYEGTTLSAALDIVAHEYTHAVIEYTAGLKNKGESGALNEAYADIMGSLIEGQNFQIGESLIELRDMTNPNKYKDPFEKDGQYYFPTDTTYYDETWKNKVLENDEDLDTWEDWDNGGVHNNSGVPNYAAYLMYKNGAFESKEHMAQVWYNSLFLLTSTSDFEDCALAVMISARNLGLEEDKIKIIEKAFVETKMLDYDYSSLSGKVTDEENNPLENVLVTAINAKNNYVYYEAYTNENGEYKFEELITNDYIVSFEKAKFETTEKEASLEVDKNTEVNASLIKIDEADYEESEIVFVIDISYSMEESDPEDIRKQIMINILASLDNNASVALVVFTAESKVINNGLSNKNVDRKILSTDIFNIANDDGSSEHSGTNGKKGLETALNLFTNRKDTRKYIVFFTDGADNRDEGPTYDEIVAKAKEENIRILSIGLGSNTELNPVELEKIARETNGKYYHATESDDLHKYDETIFEELN